MRRFFLFVFAVLAAVGGKARAGDSVVVVNEVHYNPQNPALEYVELHNQLFFRVDLSNWRFDGGITFDFPEGTIIPPRGYLVVAKDPAALAAATGFAGALGPFTGSLANEGETLKLWNNNQAFRTRPFGSSNPAPPAAEALWSGDFQEVSSTNTMSGVESVSGIGNFWNALGVVKYNGTAAGLVTDPPPFALKDSTGASSPVTLTLQGTFCANNTIASTNALFRDYVLFSSPNLSTDSNALTWHFEGLNKDKLYGLYLYGSATKTVRMRVDINVNGNAEEESFINVPANSGVRVSGIKPTADGKVFGIADTASTNTEANWAGFQLFVESGGQSAVAGNYNSSLERRRLMDEFDYGDSGKWPVAPDGSGYTLAKIDPQGGGDASNWAWSLTVNGTPGAANFPATVPATTAWNAALPKVAFNEVGEADDAVWQVEFYNYGASTVTMTGWRIVDGDTGGSYTFPETTLAAGSYLALTPAALGYRPANNEKLFLQSATQLVDAVKIAGQARARELAGTGRWLRPAAATYGTPNLFTLHPEIVINEIFYEPFDEGPEQWVEIKNRSEAPVDLTGWKFTAGIDFAFPPGTTIGPGALLVIASDAATLLAKYPGRPILGNFTGSLGKGDNLTLEDAAGNPADEVGYKEGAPWPELAAGGGASLELRDAKADNSVPESWSPSATAPLGTWQTFTYQGVADDDGIGFDRFNDFFLGLLDSGEMLLDDVSVRENPAGANIEFIQNNDFQADTVGAAPAHWRCIGNHGIHGRSYVDVDPSDPGNKCLRVVATGHTEDKHNRVETTFFTGRSVVVGRTYRISFRARWVSGCNLVNTRLYFNYLQRTSAMTVGNQWGTPGLPNSTAVVNAGPTARDVRHSPAVPAANAAVPVSALLSDPQGVASAKVFYRVESSGWQSVNMALGVDGRYSGNIPGQAAGSVVQFYLSATDGAPSPATATWPAAGPKSGAFYRVNDGGADTTGLRGNLRIIVSPETKATLFVDPLRTNRMSNHLFPGTVIDDERTIYYDCGVGLKGSSAGRNGDVNGVNTVGYSIDFTYAQPFRGVHTNVSIERAASMKEVIAKHLLNRAGGGYWSMFDEGAVINGPNPYTGPKEPAFALIAPARHTSVFLKSLFPDESNGCLYNHEVFYQPSELSVAGNPESLKKSFPYELTRGMLGFKDYGTDKEKYRWQWQLRNQRKADDYSKVVLLNRAFSVATSDPTFTTQMEALIDVDQWMRTWAMFGLNGNNDIYGRLYSHNWRMYLRPTDQRLIALPWDLDSVFQLSASTPLFPSENDAAGNVQLIDKLFTIPQYKRLFDSHVLDLVNTTYNRTYMEPWINHFCQVAGADFSSITSYIETRSNFALTTLPPSVAFAIATNGGNNFTTTASTVTLAGTGWSDVYAISRAGQPAPLTVKWTTASTWEVTLSLAPGANAITLLATDQHGTPTGSDTITITSNTASVAASTANIVISEIHYHPANATAAEHTAGFDDADDFQFVELHNISNQTVELAGSGFTQGLTCNFTGSTLLAPAGVLVLARNAAAFQVRYGFAPAGIFTGRLSHGDENVTLRSATNAIIQTFLYSDSNPWPVSADGPGYSLILRRPLTNPDPAQAINWSSSAAIGGSPGVVENTTYTSWLATFPALGATAHLDDPDQDGAPNFLEYALRTNPGEATAGLLPAATIEKEEIASMTVSYFHYHFRRHIGATDATWTPVFSPTLTPWNPEDMVHVGSVNNGDGTETVTYRSANPTNGQGYGRLKVTLE